MSLCRACYSDFNLSLFGALNLSLIIYDLQALTPLQPEMIESFGIDKKNVAKWAGLTSAVFSLSQCMTAVLWGRASDKFGRKPTILVGLTCTMICTILWGMSTTLPMAIIARALSGACNGNGTYPSFESMSTMLIWTLVGIVSSISLISAKYVWILGWSGELIHSPPAYWSCSNRLWFCFLAKALAKRMHWKELIHDVAL